MQRPTPTRTPPPLAPAPPRLRGRPRTPVSPEQQAEIVRLARKGRGEGFIALKLGLTGWQVRKHLPRYNRGWNDAQIEHLAEHAGEQDVPRLAREVSRLGPERTEPAVRAKLVECGLSGIERESGRPRGRYTLADLRADLTLERVAALTGQDTATVVAQIERREIRGRKERGAYRVWPKDLRRWAMANREKLQRRAHQIEDWHELLGLIAGEWGVTDETERREARRGRRKTEAGA